MASALALQCSTNWAMKTHILRAGHFIEFILTSDRNMKFGDNLQNKNNIARMEVDHNSSNLIYSEMRAVI